MKAIKLVEAIVEPDGKVTLPAKMLAELNLPPGTRLLVRLEDGRIILEQGTKLIDRLRGLTPKEPSLADELLAEERLYQTK